MNYAVKSDDTNKSIYYVADGFAQEEQVFHGFFGRNGGVSADIYSSLNMGRGSKDNPENVAGNFAIVGRASGLASDKIMTLYQVHGDTCMTVQEPWSLYQRPEADALVTDVPGIGLGILTADCAPVLFMGKKEDDTPVIGAAHAGWKGALGGALDSTIKAMKKRGAVLGSIKAAIGPCITQNSYEVDEAFMHRFCEMHEMNEKFFKDGPKQGKYNFDLAGYCAARLASLGLVNVVIKDLDTYSNEENFFSYRRATHRSEADYGRQISVIAIKE